MWIGSSIILMTVGAVLALAVERDIDWIDLQTAGWILMVVGGLGLLWSLLAVTSIGPWRRTDVVDR